MSSSAFGWCFLLFGSKLIHFVLLGLILKSYSIEIEENKSKAICKCC